MTGLAIRILTAGCGCVVKAGEEALPSTEDRQSRVENTFFFRYKIIIGGKLRARHPKSQKVEAILACNVLNRMIALGRPESLVIAG